MNYLAELMNAKGITPIQLSSMTGLAVTNIRRMMQGDAVKFSRVSTIQKLADALGVRPVDLVKGGEEMKNKILYAEITKAVEQLSVALRKYSGDSHYLRISIFSRDDGISFYDDNTPPDFYFMTLDKWEGLEEECHVMSENSLIYYTDTGEGEKIRKVTRLGGFNDYQERTQE